MFETYCLSCVCAYAAGTISELVRDSERHASSCLAHYNSHNPATCQTYKYFLPLHQQLTGMHAVETHICEERYVLGKAKTRSKVINISQKARDNIYVSTTETVHTETGFMEHRKGRDDRARLLPTAMDSSARRFRECRHCTKSQ